MATYTAIADVSRTLVELLGEQFADREDIVSLTADTVSLVDPEEVSPDDETRLSVSLFHLEENASMKNSQPSQPTDPTVSQPSPLALDLYYLVTAHPGHSEESTAQRLEGQRVLGVAMQTFHDNAILRDDQLQGTLADDGPLNVSLVNSSLGERTNRWSAAPETAFQPSVLYHVGPVLIDSRQREEITPVSERKTALDRHSE